MSLYYNMCKFCHSNGEAEVQYRSHLLKNSCGLVTCPVLRSFTCPICKATGDFAHTQRYCPQNKDGKFNSGASLTELKKKKNAAGNFPSNRKISWPISTYSKVCCSYTAKLKSHSPPHTTAMNAPTTSPPKYMMMTDPLHHHPMTDHLPSCYCPPSPPTILTSQPPSAQQLAMYNHMQYLDYYHNKQLHHQAEINRLKAIREAARVTSPSPPPCYIRNFPSPMSVTPPGSPQDKIVFPKRAGYHHGGHGMEELDILKDLWQEVSLDEDKQVNFGTAEDVLGNMLAKLREGTEEYEV